MSNKKGIPEMFVFPTKPEHEKQFKKAYEDYLKIVDEYRDDPNFDFLPFVMNNSDQYMKCIKRYMDPDEFELYKLKADKVVLKDEVKQLFLDGKIEKSKTKEAMMHYRLQDTLIDRKIEALEKKIKEKNETKPEVKEEIKAEIEDEVKSDSVPQQVIQ